MEAAVDIPVLDSTASGIWACLDAMAIDTTPAAGLGSLFRMPAARKAFRIA